MFVFISKIYLSAVRFLLVVIMLAGSLSALPLYTARSGRICDNCHMNPFETEKQGNWPNPAELAKRKCNLSCSTCHIDTNGGGLRKVAGRYYGASTIPAFNTETRPYWDHWRSIRMYYLKWTVFDKLAKAEKKKETRPVKKAVKTKTAEADEAEEKKAAHVVQTKKPLYDKKHETPAFWTWRDPFVFGRAINSDPQKRTYSPMFGIYGDMNADPFLALSGNIRTLYNKTETRESFFLMNAEAGALLHPVDHFTIAASAGYLGFENPRNGPVIPFQDRTYIKQAVAMLHDLPYMFYAKAGAFLPAFGVRHDDHTAPNRRFFDMDYSRRNNGAYGAEIGIAPNYPYASVSAFTNMGKDYNQTDGWGAAAQFGWRDLLFGGGFSFMIKKRQATFGGNLNAASFDWYINLGRIFFTVPIVFIGEFAAGNRDNLTGPDRTFYANFIEINYLVLNGVNLKVGHHFFDPDMSVRNNENGRIGAGFDYIPFHFMKFSFEYRWMWQIPVDNQWRKGLLLNPSDFVFDDQMIFVTHIFF